jgi:fatty-acyl-CoA synthase
VTAVVSLKVGQYVTADELRDYMRGTLARYKVAKAFVVVDEVPKSAAGKILRTEARKLAIDSQPQP